jgi:hypothetical protein
MPHHTHLALGRSRQEDFLRDAERNRLTAAARRDRRTLRDRLIAGLAVRQDARLSGPVARYRSRSAV